MSEIPKLKKRSSRTTINISIDRQIDELYRLAKQNGYDSSEIARQAVSAAFLKLENQVKKRSD